MPALRLFVKLAVYYAALALLVWMILALFPNVEEYLPVGRIQALLTEGGKAFQKGHAGVQVSHLSSFWGSIGYLVLALLGAIITSLPVSWVYASVRNPEDYDQSLVGTIVMLPVVVTSIVVIVQDSLALSFSLAGIAGAARFRNSMKSSGDLLFALIAITIGLSAGIGALELAYITSAIFNLCFVLLWSMEYGERAGMKRYLHDFDPNRGAVTATSVTVTQVTEEPPVPRP